MSPMQINLRPSDGPVIQWMRPVSPAIEGLLREQDAPILPPPTTWYFSRAEWTMLVTSGLVYALGYPHGWDDWDQMNRFRPYDVDEREHLLVVAALLLQQQDSSAVPSEWLLPQPPWQSGAVRALYRLVKRALQYRRDEGIAEDPLPWPRFGQGVRLPDPNFQAPRLEMLVEETHIDTLVDLAKHGEEATFKELAQTLGVPAEKLDELWVGTVRRVTR